MSSDVLTHEREQRWAAEAAYFDAEAERRLRAVRPLNPLSIARYSGKLRRYNREEFRYWLLGDLRGRRVLDVGCGEGLNSMVLSTLGASVTGIDISPKAIAVAERRAEVNGVADRCRFLCAPLETAEFEPGSFDVVWGDAILHHLLPELDAVLPRLVGAARPGGLVMFAEPINLSPWLRRIRLMLPVNTDATPDERPLEEQDLDVLRRHLKDLHVEPFRLLGRVERFVSPTFHYEGTAWWRRRTLDALALADRGLFSMNVFRACASTAVLWARV